MRNVNQSYSRVSLSGDDDNGTENVHKMKHLRNGDCLGMIASCWHVVDKARFRVAGRSAVEVNIEKERFTVVCSRRRLEKTTSKDYDTQVRAARAARLFFLNHCNLKIRAIALCPRCYLLTV